MLNKPFFDPAVCEKNAMRLDMNLLINQTKQNYISYLNQVHDARS